MRNKVNPSSQNVSTSTRDGSTTNSAPCDSLPNLAAGSHYGSVDKRLGSATLPATKAAGYDRRLLRPAPANRNCGPPAPVNGAPFAQPRERRSCSGPGSRPTGGAPAPTPAAGSYQRSKTGSSGLANGVNGVAGSFDTSNGVPAGADCWSEQGPLSITPVAPQQLQGVPPPPPPPRAEPPQAEPHSDPAGYDSYYYYMPAVQPSPPAGAGDWSANTVSTGHGNGYGGYAAGSQASRYNGDGYGYNGGSYPAAVNDADEYYWQPVEAQPQVLGRGDAPNPGMGPGAAFMPAVHLAPGANGAMPVQQPHMRSHQLDRHRVHMPASNGHSAAYEQHWQQPPHLQKQPAHLHTVGNGMVHAENAGLGLHNNSSRAAAAPLPYEQQEARRQQEQPEQARRQPEQQAQARRQQEQQAQARRQQEQQAQARRQQEQKQQALKEQEQAAKEQEMARKQQEQEQARKLQEQEQAQKEQEQHQQEQARKLQEQEQLNKQQEQEHKQTPLSIGLATAQNIPNTFAERMAQAAMERMERAAQQRATQQRAAPSSLLSSSPITGRLSGTPSSQGEDERQWRDTARSTSRRDSPSDADGPKAAPVRSSSHGSPPAEPMRAKLTLQPRSVGSNAGAGAAAAAPVQERSDDGRPRLKLLPRSKPAPADTAGAGATEGPSVAGDAAPRKASSSVFGDAKPREMVLQSRGVGADPTMARRSSHSGSPTGAAALDRDDSATGDDNWQTVGAGGRRAQAAKGAAAGGAARGATLLGVDDPFFGNTTGAGAPPPPPPPPVYGNDHFSFRHHGHAHGGRSGFGSFGSAGSGGLGPEDQGCGVFRRALPTRHDDFLLA